MRRRMRKGQRWWIAYIAKVSTAPGELVLAIGMTLWAVLLALPGNSFTPGSAFGRLENVFGHDEYFSVISAFVAVLCWCGLLYPRWPSKIRIASAFAQAMFWLYVTLDSIATRWKSPAWALPLMAAMGAYYVFRQLRLEAIRSEVQ